MRARDRLAVAERGAAAGHVEERLVQADRLDQRRVGREDRHHLLGQLAVALRAAGQEDAVRAAARRRAQRHGRLDAELARLVRGGHHHAALVRAAADDDRLAAQGRVVEHLDAGVEGVEVGVEDGAHAVEARRQAGEAVAARRDRRHDGARRGGG